MRLPSFSFRSVFVATVLIALLLGASACAQSDRSKEAAESDAPEISQSSDAIRTMSSEDDSEASSVAKSSQAISKPPRVSKSIADVFDSIADGVNSTVEGAQNAISEAADSVNKQMEEWEKERQEAEKKRVKEALEDAKLTPTTDHLEYSQKTTKPIKLVECSDRRIDVSAKGKIDLSKVGTKKVTYKLDYEDQSVEQTVKFKIRDTKAPKIDFASKAPKIAVGEDYTPIQNVNWVKDPVDGELERVDSAPTAQGKKAGSEKFYDKGWYTVDGYVDVWTPGVYSVDVNASDVHGNTAHRSFDVRVEAPEPQIEEAAPQAAPVASYVLNTNTRKFHFPSCRSVKRMKAENRDDVEMSRDEIIGMGYEPCGICMP